MNESNASRSSSIVAVKLSGLEPGEDIEIEFTGLRPGEKLYEELITEGEGIVRTDCEKIFVLKGNGFDPDWLNRRVAELLKLASEQDALGIKAKLKEIIPEYEPSDTNLCTLPPDQHNFASEVLQRRPKQPGKNIPSMVPT